MGVFYSPLSRRITLSQLGSGQLRNIDAVAMHIWDAASSFDEFGALGRSTMKRICGSNAINTYLYKICHNKCKVLISARLLTTTETETDVPNRPTRLLLRVEKMLTGPGKSATYQDILDQLCNDIIEHNANFLKRN